MGEIKIISLIPQSLSTKAIPAMMGEMEFFHRHLFHRDICFVDGKVVTLHH